MRISDDGTTIVRDNGTPYVRASKAYREERRNLLLRHHDMNENPMGLEAAFIRWMKAMARARAEGWSSVTTQQELSALAAADLLVKNGWVLPELPAICHLTREDLEPVAIVAVALADIFVCSDEQAMQTATELMASIKARGLGLSSRITI